MYLSLHVRSLMDFQIWWSWGLDITFFMPKWPKMGKILSFKIVITVFFCDNCFFFAPYNRPKSYKKILSHKKKSYHVSIFLKKKLSFQIFGKWKNAKSLLPGHKFDVILRKICFVGSLYLAKKSYQVDKSLWNWFSNTRTREQKTHFHMNFFVEIFKYA